MRAFLFAGALATCISTPVHQAHAEELSNSGYWSTFRNVSNTGNVGTAICGMETRYGDNPNDPFGAIFIKYFKGYPGLTVHLFKHGWLGHYHIPMRLYLDQTLITTVTAEGSQPAGSQDMGMIEFFISADRTMSFLGEFADANWMWLMFDAGNEGNWRANMRGSRNAVLSFQNCVADLNTAPVASNPPPTVDRSDRVTPGRDIVRIYPDQNGQAAFVDVGLGDQTVRMALDTGASHIVISSSVAEQLVKTGEANWGADTKSQLADGTIVTVKTVMINMVRLGNHIIHYVPAMVTPKGDMLLGLSVLREIGKFSIDMKNGVLEFNGSGS
jgi:clan AA aspartic protease (TIGR02281 family)